MPSLASRTVGIDASKYESVEARPSTSPGLPQITQTKEPGLNSTLRSPLPPIYAATDNLRQYYQGSQIPQTRTFPVPSLTSLGTKGADGAAGPAGPAGTAGTQGPPGPSGQPAVTRNSNGVFVQTSDGLGGYIYQAWGIVSAAATGNKFSAAAITFPVAFPGNPVVVLTPLGDSDGSGNNAMSCYADSVSTTGCTAELACAVNVGGTGSSGFVNVVQVQWNASY